MPKNNSVYVIAEMACSHEGNPELAKVIIDGAGKAGADAIQLQIWSLNDMMTPSHGAYATCQKIELSKESWRSLVAYSRTRYPKMGIYAFAYEHLSIDFIESLGLDGYKLSSADLSNPAMLKAVAATGKHINLSVGASTVDEVEAAIICIRNISPSPITLMYGIQSFPTTISDVHLNYVHTLAQRFGLPVGYQDHCDANSPSAFWIPALAVGMGVSVIEKHITHDRSKKGIDHESALNPDEFERFVAMVRQLEQAKGSADERPFSEAELKYRKFQKKSVVAGRNLKTGELLQSTDILFLRSSDLGLAPDKANHLIGKKLTGDILKYQLIQEKDVQ